MFGYRLLDVPGRLARFAEGVEITSLLLRSETPVSYDGTYYHLREARLLPRPQRPGGPPLVIGGGRAVLPLVARYADEWNVGFVNPAQYVALNGRLDQLLAEQGREPGAVRRSVMLGVVFGRGEEAVRTHAAQRARDWGVTEDALPSQGFVVGQGGAIAEQLRAYADAGAQRVMLQWLDMDDIDGLASLARDVLP
jgi:alkanesulfonate monooxygenase SsuD/methylene tetrahydromethanopterin reductase-like flavin-dependent oxidoreductase (luciferase family)